MSGVLVLNATFEPLAVVSARRAVCLVLAEKVETLHATGRAFRSERRSVDVPSVVRLSHYVNVPRPRHRSPNRRAVFARDRDACQYCGARAETMDHVRAPQPGRAAHLGERGGRVPAVQRQEARPASERERDDAAAPATASRAVDVGRDRRGRCSRRVDDLPETRKRPPDRVSPWGDRAGRAPADGDAREPRPAEHGDLNWVIEHRSGSVPDLFGHPEPPHGASRLARLHTVERPGLVLGSSQRTGTADGSRAASAGVEVVRRRSGGGAVLLGPGSQVWADFFVAATDPLWHDDVTLAARWVGRLWSSVVAKFATAPCSVHAGRLVADRWGRLVCFASAGPGEVFVDGRKVVGISQRRSRDRVRFQTAARLQPDADRRAAVSPDDDLDELGLLDLSPAERAEGRTVLASRCTAIPATEPDLTRALIQALRDSG